MFFNQTIQTPGATLLSIYMGFRLETSGVHWYFKDTVQTRFRELQYVVYEYFSVLKFWFHYMSRNCCHKRILHC